jgi:putative ATP-dependent endonuclease of OLD family
MIKKIHIKNFKSIEEITIDNLNPDKNIFVGNNESGKSTILEAINLCLTKKHYGESVDHFLHPFMFNIDLTKQYLKDNPKTTDLPYILIELYFESNEILQSYRGSQNDFKEDAIGISLKIQFNAEYTQILSEIYNDPYELQKTEYLPHEFYHCEWEDFSGGTINLRKLYSEIKCNLIDSGGKQRFNSTERISKQYISQLLEPKEISQLDKKYNDLRKTFTNEDIINNLNSELLDLKEYTEKPMKLGLDLSPKHNWINSTIPYLDNIPYDYVGQGEQSIVNTLLAIQARSSDSFNIILLEEPENHLSHSKMSSMLKLISDKTGSNSQLFITSHSPQVVNRLGLNNIFLTSNKGEEINSFSSLNKDDYQFFQKATGFDTLRVLLADKLVLVEGPADEMIYNKCFESIHKCEPREKGVDVISCNGLTFKRYLELIKISNNSQRVHVLRDNDKDDQSQYLNEYKNKCEVFYEKDLIENYTLEPYFYNANETDNLDKLLKTLDRKNNESKDDTIKWMMGNKTNWALKVAMSDFAWNYPTYISNSVNQIIT